jgi:hypothetical protein
MNKLYFFFASAKVVLGATTLIWAIILASDIEGCPDKNNYKNLPNVLIVGFIIDGTILTVSIGISGIFMQNFILKKALQYSSFPLLLFNIYTVVFLTTQFACTAYALWILSIIDHSFSILFHCINIGNYCCLE